MKRLTAVLVAALIAALGLTLTNPSTASAAARRRHHDTPGCIDKKEYRAIRSGMTPAQVARIADISGAQIDYADNGYEDAVWVDDGYWQPDGEWMDMGGTFDEFGNYIPDMEWVDESYWVDTSYISDTWVPVLDTVRSYKKCKSFGHGRSRVGIEFDNYTHGDALSVFTKRATNPYSLVALVDLMSARSTSKPKDVPTPNGPGPKPTKPITPKPHFKPLTPKPAHA